MVCFSFSFIFLPLPNLCEQLTDLFHRFLPLPVDILVESSACPASLQNRQQTTARAQGTCQHHSCCHQATEGTRSPVLVKFT